jgi:hypothetical protein
MFKGSLSLVFLFSYLANAEVPEALRRTRGQTEFLTVTQQGMMHALGGKRAMMMTAAASLESAGGTDQREQKESDVYAIGAKGSGLVYLLNDHRGLQVVKFDKNKRGTLVGHVRATGNYPRDMYLDEEKQKILVLERYNYGQESTEESSRILIYDVSSPDRPKLESTVNLDGEIADSRMVGDVLYIATSVPWRARYQGDDQGRKGKIASFKWGKDNSTLEQIASQELTLKDVQADKMGIIEVPTSEKGKFRYYLSAVMSEERWSWWGTQSYIELVDITSPDGKMKPVLRASAKGRVNHRSWIHVKDNTLIVTSNYLVENGKRDPWRGIGRVAVETFKFPDSKSEIISTQEAQYRMMHLERKVKGAEQRESEEDLDLLRRELLSDKELGLKGRFVRHLSGEEGSGEEWLVKEHADTVITVGDTNGQSAALQDVRYTADQAYVFWVPANNIDPLDRFDLRDVQNKGTPYLGRLQFDGWISKSYNLTYDGKKYVVGLGFVVPAVDNEKNSRYLQIALFEIVDEADGKSTAKQISTATSQMSGAFADLTGEDKAVTFEFNSKSGEGNVMFPVGGWDGMSYKGGGITFHFDLSKATVAEGPLLQGEAWLKKVFNNSDVGHVGAFSDEALGVYDGTLSEHAVATGVKTVTASQTLELARNVESFVSLMGATTKKIYGVQLVGKSRQEGREYKNEIELRVMPTLSPDGELHDALLVQSFEGSLVGMERMADGEHILLVTHAYAARAPEAERHSAQDSIYTVRLLRVGGTAKKLAFEEVLKHEEVVKAQGRGVSGFRRFYRMGSASQLESVGSGSQYVFTHSSGAFLLNLAKASKAKDASLAANIEVLEMDAKKVSEENPPEVRILGGEVFLLVKEQATVKELEGGYTTALRHFLVPVDVSGGTFDYDLKNKINIPGEPLALLNDDTLIVEDSVVMDIKAAAPAPKEQRQANPPTLLQEDKLIALKLDFRKKTAAIQDLVERSREGEIRKLSEGLFFLVEANNYPSYGPRIMPAVWRPNPIRRRASASAKLVFLKSNAKGLFEREALILPELELQGSVRVVKHWADPKDPSRLYLLLSDHNKAQVYVRTAKGVELVPVRVSDESGVLKKEVVKSFELGRGAYYYSSGEAVERVDYESVFSTVTLAQGMSGVCQVTLVESPKASKTKKKSTRAKKAS